MVNRKVTIRQSKEVTVKKTTVLMMVIIRSTKWILACIMAIFMLTGNYALAAGRGQGKGQEKQRDNSQDKLYYRDQDREAIRQWYDGHKNNLPPGLAKKDQLPPGLEKKLVRSGALPPGLQKRLQPCPKDLERHLPPPPRDCMHMVLGGHIILLNKKSNLILDIFNLEIR
jgi:hypothetical protein